MNREDFIGARRRGVPDEFLAEAQQWQCPDCNSTDVTLEWQFDRKAPKEDIIWHGQVYKKARYKRWVQFIYYHEATCPMVRTPVGVG